MIEAFRVPDWVTLLIRMTRRQVRLRTQQGQPRRVPAGRARWSRGAAIVRPSTVEWFDSGLEAVPALDEALPRPTFAGVAVVNVEIEEPAIPQQVFSDAPVAPALTASGVLSTVSFDEIEMTPTPIHPPTTDVVPTAQDTATIAAADTSVAVETVSRADRSSMTVTNSEPAPAVAPAIALSTELPAPEAMDDASTQKEPDLARVSAVKSSVGFEVTRSHPAIAEPAAVQESPSFVSLPTELPAIAATSMPSILIPAIAAAPVAVAAMSLESVVESSQPVISLKETVPVVMASRVDSDVGQRQQPAFSVLVDQSHAVKPTAAPAPLAVPVASAPLTASVQPVIPAPVKPPTAAAKPATPPVSSVLAPAVEAQYNRTGTDFRRPMPRPKVNGLVIDFHCHLLAERHADRWFEAADHFGIDCFLTMSPLEEVVGLQRQWGHRVQFIAMPKWGDTSVTWPDEWLTRIESFYNLGSRIAKFHAAPGTMLMRGHRLDEPIYKPLLNEVRDRKMAIMTHIGDPDTWYAGKYADAAKYGTREEHYQMWESLLEEYRGTTWIGAHLGGNPENLPRLQSLLDRFPDLILDCSATRWMAREISARRDPAREFFIRNQDRILFGSDQVSFDDRGYDFLASRFWVHRKLWETAYIGPSPIIDPDVSAENQPVLRGLALPDEVLQKMYHDNPLKLLAKLGMSFDGWG